LQGGIGGGAVLVDACDQVWSVQGGVLVQYDGRRRAAEIVLAIEVRPVQQRAAAAGSAAGAGRAGRRVGASSVGGVDFAGVADTLFVDASEALQLAGAAR
jgi:hypothetical protein